MTIKGNIQVPMTSHMAASVAKWLAELPPPLTSLACPPEYQIQAQNLRLELLHIFRKFGFTKRGRRYLSISREAAQAFLWGTSPAPLLGLDPFTVRATRKRIDFALRRKNWKRNRTSAPYAVGDRQAQRYAAARRHKDQWEAFIAAIPPGGTILSEACKNSEIYVDDVRMPETMNMNRPMN